MRQVFPIASMSPLILVLTIPLLGLPALFLWLGFGRTDPAGPILFWVGAGLGLLWLGIWLHSRPTRFEVGEGELVVVWPVRRRRLACREIRDARVLSAAEFRREFGNTPRIGVGGLWGVFGWLWSRRRGLIDVYVTRLDGWVLIERAEGHPLVITPDRPEAFVRELVRPE